MIIFYRYHEVPVSKLNFKIQLKSVPVYRYLFLKLRKHSKIEVKSNALYCTHETKYQKKLFESALCYVRRIRGDAKVKLQCIYALNIVITRTSCIQLNVRRLEPVNKRGMTYFTKAFRHGMLHTIIKQDTKWFVVIFISY